MIQLSDNWDFISGIWVAPPGRCGQGSCLEIKKNWSLYHGMCAKTAFER